MGEVKKSNSLNQIGFAEINKFFLRRSLKKALKKLKFFFRRSLRLHR